MKRPLTRQQALERMPDGYSRSELELIWENSAQPINEIKALVKVSSGEARKLWNARLRVAAAPQRTVQ